MSKNAVFIFFDGNTQLFFEISINRNINTSLNNLLLSITPKRVTSDEAVFTSQRLGNTAPNNRRSGGEPLAALCSTPAARDSNPRPPAPTAIS